MANASKPVVPGDNLSQLEEERQVEDEFGYCTSEDSLFEPIEEPEDDKAYPRTGTGKSIKKDSKANVKNIKSVLKKFNENSKTYEFLVRFQV